MPSSLSQLGSCFPSSRYPFISTGAGEHPTEQKNFGKLYFPVFQELIDLLGGVSATSHRHKSSCAARLKVAVTTHGSPDLRPEDQERIAVLYKQSNFQ
jgi:hypothetical protein